MKYLFTFTIFVVFLSVGISNVSAQINEALVPDDNLREVIRNTLGITANEDLTIAALEGLTTLMKANGGITDLTGLEHATYLKLITLRVNQISSLSPLSGLTGLEKLNVGANDIDDLSALSGLTELNLLVADQNKITDISHLSGLTKL